ncbi:MAG: QacE family quaternary ammonium compound efflux SMR transporter [Burkholderiales bacterium 66-5]|uniref:SMR family transporter n=1 Tax=Comamonas badia TaxID=265291 RepID=UPI000408F407|nr:SMR family transporter [Comamonas badia]OJU89212.1 MAG: QacE family quaternary ammonium compound efflux SMR transporter [Burkholderiales bacterium 66-5]
MNHPWVLLGISIVAEVIATTALKSSQGLSRIGPSLLAVAGYCLAFYLVAKVMEHLPTGVVYAVWSGLGIVLISIVGWLWHGQRLDAAALLGMLLIVAGVLVIQLFSRAADGA